MNGLVPALPLRLISVLILSLLFAGRSVSQCVSGPVAPVETALDPTYKQLLEDQPGCFKATDAKCPTVKADLLAFQAATLTAAAANASCAAGAPVAGGGSLPVKDVAWYAQRAAFWNSIYLDMQQNAATVSDGTYKLSQTFQAEYLGTAITKSPTAPTVSGKLSAGMTVVTGVSEAVDAAKLASNIYICVWPSKPEAGSLDCTTHGATTSTASLKSKLTDANGHQYVTSDPKKGSFTAELATGLSNGQFVSVVQTLTPVAGGASSSISSAAATPVGPATQCNGNYLTAPYSDCDDTVSLIGGVEQSAQSSLQSQTTPFLRLFTRAAVTPDNPLNIWAYVRLLGAPTTSSTNGVVSVVTNPSGSLTTQTFSTIGTSIDYVIGAEYKLFPRHDLSKAYSASIIVGFGATTPLQTNSLALAYTAPAFGTVECGQLFSRFQSQFAADNIVLGSSGNSASPVPCLVNKNSLTATNATSYTPVTTIGFSNQDRTSFLGKDLIGIRTIDRFLGTGNIACGDPDTVNHIGACERGIVDFTFGQDASITGGTMSRFIFKVDAVHPLPVPSIKFLYLFGSMSIRLSRNKNYSPLILQSASVSTLTGTGSMAIPNPGVVVLSLVQPDRDYYRFGVGVNLNQIFTKLASASSSTTASPTQ